MTFAEKIRQNRLALRLTQQNVSAALGCGVVAVSYWERGLRLPRADKLRPMAILLDIPYSELIALYNMAAAAIDRSDKNRPYTRREYRERETGKRIRAVRLRNHMTQAEFAESIGYATLTVGSWERGESVPRIAILRKIAEKYGVTLEWLMEGM